MKIIDTENPTSTSKHTFKGFCSDMNMNTEYSMFYVNSKAVRGNNFLSEERAVFLEYHRSFWEDTLNQTYLRNKR